MFDENELLPPFLFLKRKEDYGPASGPNFPFLFNPLFDGASAGQQKWRKRMDLPRFRLVGRLSSLSFSASSFLFKKERAAQGMKD